ncbi:Indigoidine synthase A like protein-domain-containing protein [Xylaria bambusicola]|uniref:Indigoidine synthase A like protein-domain-containing protein n=1 Tax=Xylaria bambusicola TaxID=326684 RepID=UPI002008CA3B|nr:Indigoidine synthase A like protein-domain-containing protein [Xylaria bambusicola]KAI0523760.1 Indigoidine synthase A like protein-domain-containing protein [Xylaria bambusicola]
MQMLHRPLTRIGRWTGHRWALNVSGLKEILRVSEEVTDALATNKPVVALESTIYTHGALGNDLELEAIVRRNGGVPAVVGILGGVPTVGLTPDEVNRMVEGSPKKASRRDLAFLVGSGMVGQKVNGGTTIAGTMVLARLAGIRVFGTGGLGGVHRGGHISFDISADLTELGRTRMAVVCSGSKGFLDIPRTLEYLETQGVLVSTFADGRTGDIDLPGFWARESGIKSPFVVQDEEHAAAILLAQERLKIETGLIMANPVPVEHEIPGRELNAIIEQAVREADEQGAHGNANTPFILKRIRELTNGRSVPANKALVQSNVERAAKLASAVSRLISEGPSTPNSSVSSQADILVAGSVAVDLSCDYTCGNAVEDPIPQLHTSNPSNITQSIGGVGRNVALAAHRVNKNMKVRLCSMVGRDLAGSTVLASLESCGMDTSNIQVLSHDEHQGARTAQYVSVNDANKHLVLAMADMDIFTSQSFSPSWATIIETSKPKWLVVDANWKDHDIRSWMQAGKTNNAQVAFEPVSKAKSARLFCTGRSLESLGVFPHATVDLTTPNQYELAAMHAAAQNNEYFEDPRWWTIIDAFSIRGARDRFVKLTSAGMTDAGIPQQAIQLLPFIPTIITKLGSDGALLTAILKKDDPRLYDAKHEPFILSRCINDHPDVGGVYMRMYPSVELVTDVASVNGIGDTFMGTLVAGLAQGGRIENLINVAQKAAVLTLRSPESVSENVDAQDKIIITNDRQMRPTIMLRPDLSIDSEPSSESDYQDLEYSTEEESETETQNRQRKRAPREKDSDEEDLERFVLGDAANFRANLFKDDYKVDGEDSDTDALGRVLNNDEATGLENAEDADFFAFDIDLGPKSASGQQLVAAPSAKDRSQPDSKDAPAWEDSDDERLTISLANVTQLRKLRASEAEDVINGTEYTLRLRQQFLRLNPLPEWARKAEEPPKKRRRRSSAATDSSYASDENMESDDINADALPLDKLLRDSSTLNGSTSTKTKKLRPEVIDIQRSRDIPDTHKDVTSLAFHPKYPVLLSSSTSSMLFLHHIAPTAYPTPNPMLTSTKVSLVPVRRAQFTSDGSKIFMAGRRRYIHSWDIESGEIQKTNKIQGHQEEQRTWERFRLSPCGRYLGLIASTRKGGGVINILNVHTMQWISAARLDSRGGIIDFCWWRTGNGLTILGKGGQVGEYSMVSKRFLGVWNDEGSNTTSAIALGGSHGPDLLGEDRWVAIGAASGVVNIYDRHTLILPSKEDELLLKPRPGPVRALMNLITPVTVLTFSPDGQLLAMATRHKRDGLKLVHLPSCTVYRNWPTEQTPLGRIEAVAFGAKSNMLAVGNDQGKIRLWEIRS